MKIFRSNIIIDRFASIKDTLSKIKKNGEGVCFICDDNEKLIGILTQGDIRNIILRGVSINASINKYINRKFFSLPVSIDNAEAQKYLKVGRKIIPLINRKKQFVDYISITKSKNIPLVRPDLNGNEIEYLIKCIKSSYVSSVGKYIDIFENKFKNYYKANSALSVSSCTTGLQLILSYLNLKKDDEVIVPNVTFISPINAIIHSGGKPVFCDINNKNWTIDTEDLKKKISKKTKAIICVHTYGHPCNMDEINKLVKGKKISLIEDCAEAIGTKFKGRNIGSFGRFAVFSFYGNKTITTGEGGMVLFKSKKDFIKCKNLRNHGMDNKKKYWHNAIGFNFRMTNVQAAIGVAQFEKLNFFIRNKINIANEYKKNLQGFKNIILPFEEKWAQHSYWLYTILIKNTSKNKRYKIIKKLNDAGIEARPMFYPASDMKIYKKYLNKNSKYKNISYSGISLPSFVGLKKNQINLICKKLKELIV